MPYIKQEERGFLDRPIHVLAEEIESVGELNYAITSLVHAWLAREPVRYATLNEAIGAFECAKLELYRRVVAPYEDQKIAENGDLPPVGEGR